MRSPRSRTTARSYPHVVDGRFHTDRACGELNPVLWLMLTRHGIPLGGPAPADLGVRVDPERVRRWNLDNLRSYWHPLAGRIRLAVAGRAHDAPADAAGMVWAVLGPARLHYTLATGEVTSKTVRRAALPGVGRAGGAGRLPRAGSR